MAVVAGAHPEHRRERRGEARPDVGGALQPGGHLGDLGVVEEVLGPEGASDIARPAAGLAAGILLAAEGEAVVVVGVGVAVPDLQGARGRVLGLDAVDPAVDPDGRVVRGGAERPLQDAGEPAAGHALRGLVAALVVAPGDHELGDAGGRDLEHAVGVVGPVVVHVPRHGEAEARPRGVAVEAERRALDVIVEPEHRPDAALERGARVHAGAGAPERPVMGRVAHVPALHPVLDGEERVEDAAEAGLVEHQPVADDAAGGAGLVGAVARGDADDLGAAGAERCRPARRNHAGEMVGIVDRAEAAEGERQRHGGGERTPPGGSDGSEQHVTRAPCRRRSARCSLPPLRRRRRCAARRCRATKAALNLKVTPEPGMKVTCPAASWAKCITVPIG